MDYSLGGGGVREGKEVHQEGFYAQDFFDKTRLSV